MKYVYVFIGIKGKSEKRHIGFTIQMVIQINVCQSPLKIVLLMVCIFLYGMYIFVRMFVCSFFLPNSNLTVFVFISLI